MLTALISWLTGIASGVIPQAMKIWADKSEAKREREFLELQHKWELERMQVGIDEKMRDRDANASLEEMRATTAQMQALVELTGRPTGIVWIDAFSALLRPALSAGVLLLFFWVAYVFVDAMTVKLAAGKMSVGDFNNALTNSLIGEAVLSALGFLFGYRSSAKKA